MKPTTKAMAALALLAGTLLAPGAWAHGAMHGTAARPAAATQARPVSLADVALVDQDGRRVRLAADVVADKLVVVNFVFTHCAHVCPVVSNTFARVQEELGTLLDERVRLVSLTVDPARDTSGVLKEYAAKFEARPGWLWLTGAQADVTAALQGFGVHISKVDMHPAVIVIGDARSGRWTRVYDTESPAKVMGRVRDLLAARD